MRVLFVGSNPPVGSNGEPFVGTKSHTILKQWLQEMKVEHYVLANVSNLQTNRKLRVSEYEGYRLLSIVDNHGLVVALGNTASDALSRIGIEHFKLPHPSGKNRKLNDKAFVKNILKECSQWIKERSR